MSANNLSTLSLLFLDTLALPPTLWLPMICETYASHVVGESRVRRRGRSRRVVARGPSEGWKPSPSGQLGENELEGRRGELPILWSGWACGGGWREARMERASMRGEQTGMGDRGQRIKGRT